MKRLLHVLCGDDALSIIQRFEAAARARGIAIDESHAVLAATLIAAYPALRTQIESHPEDIPAISRGKLRIARDLRTYRRQALTLVPDLSDHEALRHGLRRFVNRERLRIAARELHTDEDTDVTSRELSDLAQASIELALTEAERWAEERFGKPVMQSGDRCAFTVLGMGKLGGRELNCGSDVDLLPFYETDEGTVVKEGKETEQTLHEHFTRITQRFTATLEDVTEDGFAWRVDLRLRPEGSRGPVVNALAAAERYYETWGRSWERAALLRARPIAGHPGFGARVLEALAPFVWRKVVDPRIAHEMVQLVQRARIELSDNPERDLKLGPGGIREAEFFVQALQLVWGGKDPRIRHPNTLEGLRRLRARGLVTDREGREVESAYLYLRRLEHRVQYATGQQTHALPEGSLLETIARSVGYAGSFELEKEREKIQKRVAARLASLTREVVSTDTGAERLEPLFSAIDSGEEVIVLTALAEGIGGFAAVARSSSYSLAPPSGRSTSIATPARSMTPYPEAAAQLGDIARHLLQLARRPDFPLGGSTRDKHPRLAATLLEALSDAADPEQATRLLASFFGRLATPSVYVRAMDDDVQMLRKVVGLLGASAFLGDKLVYHPELVESVLFAKGTPSPELARREVNEEIKQAMESEKEEDDEDVFVGALRRAKARTMMEVGLAELAGELRTRDATIVLSELADATLDHSTRRALQEKGLSGGLAVLAMGKLGGREIGYGSDLDIFFVYEGDDDDAEKYVRAAQRVLRLVSSPHGEGSGYELDTRLRPSGSQGLLVVSLESFARYHGLTKDGAPLESSPEGKDWERQALVKARACAGDVDLGRRVISIATRVAYERGAPDAAALHHLRMRMERELGREGASRYDVKLGRGGIVDVEFATQWLQMRHGDDPRVRTTDTETGLAALETCGYLDVQTVAVLREGYSFLRRLEQALRVVHGTSASLIEEGAPGMFALARRMGFRDVREGMAAQALLERYRAVSRDVRAAYVTVLGVSST